METNPADGRERLGPYEPGPLNPGNAHRWHCMCADCIAWWGTPAGQSVRRLWEDEYQGDDAAIAGYERQAARVDRRGPSRTVRPSRTDERDEDQDGDESGDGLDLRPRHYSTGRLTQRQAEVVNTWRALLLDGGEDRPRASTSDVIAVCVQGLLADPPSAQEISWYAVRSKQAHKAAGRTADRPSSRAVRGPDVPRHPPVSFYLTWETAEEYEAVRAGGRASLIAVRQGFEVEARELFPRRAQFAERRAWVAEQLAALRLPPAPPPIPAGLLARMAIDAWAETDPQMVVAEAAVYSARTHQQHHRARTDMRQLQR